MTATIEPADGFVVGEPGPRVRGVVDRYLGYRERFDVETVRCQVAGPFVVLIVGWGAPLDVVDRRAADRGVRRAASFVAGPFDAYVDTRTVGLGCGVELLLDPLAAGRILGLPMGELSNRAVPLDQLPGRWLPRLRDRLAETTGWAGRFAVLDDAIAARLASTTAPDPRMAWAWRRLADTDGRLGITGLATELGWSRRHLATVFRQETGLAPKAMARVMRFHRAYARLATAHRDGGWAGVATDCGYYDQAHLIRDFRQFAGRTPTEAARQQAEATAPAVE